MTQSELTQTIASRTLLDADEVTQVIHVLAQLEAEHRLKRGYKSDGPLHYLEIRALQHKYKIVEANP